MHCDELDWRVSLESVRKSEARLKECEQTIQVLEQELSSLRHLKPEGLHRHKSTLESELVELTERVKTTEHLLQEKQQNLKSFLETHMEYFNNIKHMEEE